MNELSKAEKRPLTVEAYDIIKKRIIDLYYRPGEVLLTQQVSNELKISRTPVREALVKLSQEGLLGQTDSRKFQVAFITRETIEEVYSLRECFEILAVGHVFSEITQNDISRMQAIIDKMEESLRSDDSDRFFQLDNEFHYYLIRKYDNKFMISFVNQLMDHQQRIRYVTMYVSNRMQSTVPEHQQILDCIKAGDLHGTYDSVRKHLRNVENETLTFLGSKEFSMLSGIQSIRL